VVAAALGNSKNSDGWICPRLEVLDLGECDRLNRSVLLAVLEARGQPKSSTQKGSVTRLRRLRLPQGFGDKGFETYAEEIVTLPMQ
jgi:hypothetical protein